MSKDFMLLLDDLRKDVVRLCLRVVAWVILFAGVIAAVGYLGTAAYVAAGVWLVGGVLAWGIVLLLVDASADLERIADHATDLSEELEPDADQPAL